MKKRIYKSFIQVLPLLISAILLSAPLSAQKVMKSDLEKKEVTPLYNGTSIGLDIFGIGSKLFGGDFLSSEVSIDVNLKNKFFPVLEVGYGTTNTTGDENGIQYKSSAPFARIGMNYNTMSKGKSASFLYVGLRYGFSAFKYDVQAPPLSDGIWPGALTFKYTDEKSHAQWLEFVVGVKAQIYKNFEMGWALRYKYRLSAKENPNSSPWYIPGFGSNSSSKFGVTYNLIYKLPF
ncbi:MAG: DUF6048 family protein [Bacteroides sp.]